MKKRTLQTFVGLKKRTLKANTTKVCDVHFFILQKLVVCAFSLENLVVCAFSLENLVVCAFSLENLVVCAFSDYKSL
jgi:hypothetical protein